MERGEGKREGGGGKGGGIRELGNEDREKGYIHHVKPPPTHLLQGLQEFPVIPRLQLHRLSSG
jgi:hypothetical protein